MTVKVARQRPDRSGAESAAGQGGGGGGLEGGGQEVAASMEGSGPNR